MTTTLKTEVYCTLQVEGLHNWPGCPHEEVAYLRDPHRHVFHIKAYKLVTHSDRDQEFIMLKHDLKRYLYDKYLAKYTSMMCEFGAKSCEMLAEELIDVFELSRCEVSEDNENGAIVTAESTIMAPLSQFPCDPKLYEEYMKTLSAPIKDEPKSYEVKFSE